MLIYVRLFIQFLWDMLGGIQIFRTGFCSVQSKTVREYSKDNNRPTEAVLGYISLSMAVDTYVFGYKLLNVFKRLAWIVIVYEISGPFFSTWQLRNKPPVKN